MALEESAKESRFWKSVEKMLSRPRSRRVEVNLGKIARLTKPGDRVVVPGKVLGGGNIGHSLTIAALSFSSAALTKLKAAGCTVMRIDEFTKIERDGSGVKIIV
ncbi:MAG: 50S ribosomal protein L18e [Candidatus Brockarchaeota archaeon]|nr:50S ribosomal protein L18e [Candidatus Brockarchaeota archaeon]